VWSRSPVRRCSAAGVNLDKGAKKSLLLAADLAGAVALRAADRLGARFGAASLALGTGLVAGNKDLLFAAKNCFLKLDPEVVAQIDATDRP